MNGTGWHRCAYILFEHKQPLKVEFNKERTFQQRSFKTSDFFLRKQDTLTPVGLCFCEHSMLIGSALIVGLALSRCVEEKCFFSADE